MGSVTEDNEEDEEITKKTENNTIPSWKTAMELKKSKLREKQQKISLSLSNEDSSENSTESISERGTTGTIPSITPSPSTLNTGGATAPIPVWREKLLQKKQALKDMKQKTTSTPTSKQQQHQVPVIITEDCSDNKDFNNNAVSRSTESPTKRSDEVSMNIDQPEEMGKKEEIKENDQFLKKKQSDIKNTTEEPKKTEETKKTEENSKKKQSDIKNSTEELKKIEETKKNEENSKKKQSDIKNSTEELKKIERN